MASTAGNNTALLAAGIFAHESGQRLLSILLMLADRGFKGLYDKCAHNLSGHYYQEGLRRVHKWSDDVVREDIAYVREACPDLDETYAACFVQYVSDRWRGGRPTVRTPELPPCAASRGPRPTGEPRDGRPARRSFAYRRVTCMDAARTRSTRSSGRERRVELLSEVRAAVQAARRGDARRLGGGGGGADGRGGGGGGGRWSRCTPPTRSPGRPAPARRPVASRPRAGAAATARGLGRVRPASRTAATARGSGPGRGGTATTGRGLGRAAAREPTPPPPRRLGRPRRATRTAAAAALRGGGGADSTVSRRPLEAAAVDPPPPPEEEAEEEEPRVPRRRLMHSSRESNVSVGLPNRRSPKH